MNTNTKTLTINGISIAMVLVATFFINIRLPFMGSGGLIHLGNVPLFIVAILYGKKTGFLAGAMGMGMFDLLSGWTAWAPFTFIIVGTMGFITGFICEKLKDKSWKNLLLAMTPALVIKIIGYYVAEVILYGNPFTPIGSILGNFLQVAVAMVIVLIIIKPLQVINKAL